MGRASARRRSCAAISDSRSDIYVLVEGSAQGLEGTRGAGLDGAWRHPKGRCCLGFGEVLQVPQDDHLALGDRQRPQGCPEPIALRGLPLSVWAGGSGRRRSSSRRTTKR